MDQGYACVGRSLSVSAENYPNKPALIEADGISLTYTELNACVNQLAHHLMNKGIRKGDHIGILSQNSLEHVIALYAAAKVGGVATAFDPRWTPSEIARGLGFFDCKILIIDDGLRPKLGETDMRHLPLGVVEYSKNVSSPAHLLAMIRSMPRTETGIKIYDHDPFTMILTSGTTGMPKGCIRSHRNVEIGCIKDVMGKGLDNQSKELVVVPVYYGTGRGSVMGQIYLGGTVHIMPSFDARRVAAYIEKERISAIALAPTMCKRILELEDLSKYDLSSLRSLRKAGSPFTLQMVSELMDRVTKYVYQGFASTESGGVTMLKPHEQISKIGSSGLPRWGVELAIVDPEGNPLGRNENGEIRVRGANVCQGYYKNLEEQAKVFKDGWYYTGDVGRIDDEGYLYVVGRIKDIIKTGSINVSPKEIENVILNLAEVEDVAVLGVLDREWGEAIKAMIVVKKGAAISEEQILAHCRRDLANFKVPKHIEFAEAIERNALGKVTAEFKAAASALHIAEVRASATR